MRWKADLGFCLGDAGRGNTSWANQQIFPAFGRFSREKRDFSVSDLPDDDNSDRAEHHLEKEQSLVAAAHAPHAANWQCQACDAALRAMGYGLPVLFCTGAGRLAKSGHVSHPVFAPCLTPRLWVFRGV